MFFFSLYRVLTEVLDDPECFGFDINDPDTEDGAIWKDGLHLTSKVHELLAKRLYAALFHWREEE